MSFKSIVQSNLKTEGSSLLRLHLALIALMLLLASSTIADGNGTTASPGISLSIGLGSSHISYSVSIFQNLTAILPSFVLPQTNGILVGANATSVVTGLQSAIQAKSPSARLSGLMLRAESTPWLNTTLTQWSNMSLGFDLDESSRSNNQGVQFDLAWRSFADSASIRLSGAELNDIGGAYLHPAALAIAGLKNSKGITYTYHLNGGGVSLSTLTAAVVSTSVLNFSSVAVPLTRWASSFNFTSGSITFSLKPLPRFTFEVQQTTQEAQPVQDNYLVTYSFQQAVFTAPSRSSIKGDTIIATFGDIQEIIMTLVIASVVAVSAGTYLIEKRMLKSPTKRRPLRQMPTKS